MESMEVRSRKQMEASKEIDGSFRGKRRRKSIFIHGSFHLPPPNFIEVDRSVRGNRITFMEVGESFFGSR